MIEIFSQAFYVFLGAASVYLFSRKRIDELNKNCQKLKKLSQLRIQS